MGELREWVKRRAGILAFLYIAILTVGVLYWANHSFEAEQDAAEARQQILCHAITDNRQVLQDLVEFSTDPTTEISEVQNPELKEVLRENVRRSRRFKEYAEELLRVPPECVGLLGITQN